MPNQEIGSSGEVKWLQLISKQIIQLTGIMSSISGGGTVISGTANTVARFGPTGTTLVDSLLKDDGVNITIPTLGGLGNRLLLADNAGLLSAPVGYLQSQIEAAIDDRIVQTILPGDLLHTSSSDALYNALLLKQNVLSGTGFVKSTAGVISYDNNTYYLNSNPAGYVPTIGTGATGTWGINVTGSAASLSANLPVNRLNSGTNASATTYWRGDGAWVNPFLSASALLDFPNTGGESSSDLTIPLVGAALGDVVILGVPNSAMLTNMNYSAWVSAVNTVTVRFNNYSSGAKNPASGTFKITIIK